MVISFISEIIELLSRFFFLIQKQSLSYIQTEKCIHFFFPIVYHLFLLLLNNIFQFLLLCLYMNEKIECEINVYIQLGA